jgi:hypothetical protein
MERENVYITMEYYSGINNEIWLFVVTQIELEIIMSSAVSQQISDDFSHLCK